MSDLPKIVEFQILMALETELLKLDPATVSMGVKAVFDDPSKGRYFVTEQSREIIGSLLIVPEWSDWRNGQVWWIHSVFVPLEYRGGKVFANIYRHVQAIVQGDENLRGLRLYVDKRNTHAQKVYEKLGMSGDHYHLFEWMKTF